MAASAATSLDHPVIDMHLHAYPADFFAMPGMPNPVTGQPSAAATDDAIRDATLEEMERLDITAAVVSGPAEAIERWTTAADGQFLASPLFPFLDHGFPDVEDLRSRIEQGTFSALAEITAQYEGYAQYRLLSDDNGLRRVFGGLRPGAVLGPLDLVARHLALDHAGVGAPPTGWQGSGDDLGDGLAGGGVEGLRGKNRGGTRWFGAPRAGCG